MKISDILICLASALAIQLSAIAQVHQDWEAFYNGPGGSYDETIKMVVDQHGFTYVLGISVGEVTGWDFAVVKYDPSGVQQWAARYDGPLHEDDYPYDLAVDSMGNVYACGFSSMANQESVYATVKFNSSGEQQWYMLYSGVPLEDGHANAITTDAAGNVYVTGSSVIDPYNIDIVTIKYNSAGVQQWLTSYSGPVNGWDLGNDIVVDQVGNVYVVGSSDGNGTDGDFITLKYNPAGVQLWEARFNGPGNGYDKGIKIALDHAGNVIVAGQCASPINLIEDYAVAKYTSAGQELWWTTYDDSVNGSDELADLVIDQNDFIYITGRSTGPNLNWDYATIKYYPNGVQQWVARQNTVGVNENAQSLAVDAEGNVYVAGAVWTSGIYGHHYSTIKYDSNGALRWNIYSGQQSEDNYIAVGLDANKNVYVSGTYPDGPYYSKMATIRYNQSPSPNLHLTLIPFLNPILIPASGGSFAYFLQVMNQSLAIQAMNYWVKVILPNGTVYGPLVGPTNVVVDTGEIAWLRYQNVPFNAPTGTYHYLACAGSYPNQIWISDTLTFSKLPSGSGPLVSNWSTDYPFLENEQTSNYKPLEFNLDGVAPNPFNPTTAIRFTLPNAGFAKLAVYTVSGQLVKTLVEGTLEAGAHEALFDGSRLASGVYLYRLDAGSFSQTQRIVLTK